ncbi:hypothetical protein N5853_05840 [Bartonella sp. HY329]|uniref:hypothetical protein n=1 Tax=unclassified Bartonella TaxID=2645622 RepID=UPI0021C89E1D|nr:MULTISPECIES: hypothetical protein [unclassified Bartonella]UXM96133.1 hypothetical protein N5853_05840 [Bartonella sp. HY329]UXN10457.1 hypothetical protein N5852_05845 [Bartonella sp. HY328]
MYKSILMLAGVLMLTGCLTLNGNYHIVEIDAKGNEVPSKLHLFAQGRGIYTIRNAYCATKPNAILRIINDDTGQELKSESPHRCGKRIFN